MRAGRDWQQLRLEMALERHHPVLETVWMESTCEEERLMRLSLNFSILVFLKRGWKGKTQVENRAQHIHQTWADTSFRP